MTKLKQISEDENHKIFQGALKFKDLMFQEPFANRLNLGNLYFSDNWVRQELGGTARLTTDKAHKIINHLKSDRKFDFKRRIYIMPEAKYDGELDNWSVFMIRERPDLLFAEVLLERPIRH